MKLIRVTGFIVLISIISCKQEQIQVAIPTDTEKTEIIPIGQKASGTLLSTLQSELKGAIESKGIIGAITICNDRALDITDSLSQNSPRIQEIKRTSFNYRNPKNKPDSHEQEALTFFSSNPANLKEVLVQKIIKGKQVHFRYYKPLVIKPVCVLCHGPRENMAPDLTMKLNDFYPDDKATGYQIGDFRGVVRVSIK
jgi:hypothetical protein